MTVMVGNRTVWNCIGMNIHTYIHTYPGEMDRIESSEINPHIYG